LFRPRFQTDLTKQPKALKAKGEVEDMKKWIANAGLAGMFAILAACGGAPNLEVASGEPQVEGVLRASNMVCAFSGSLDTGFGTSGKRLVGWGSTSADWGEALAIQRSGGADKLILVGTTPRASDPTKVTFGIIRLGSGGVLDTSFNPGNLDGKNRISLGTNSAYARAVAVDSQKRILVAGYYTGSNDDFAVIRLDSNGVLDNSFDFDGIKIISVNSTGQDQALAIAIGNSDEVYLAGFSSTAGNDDFALVKLDNTGALDPGYGTGGIITTAIGTSGDRAKAIHFDSATNMVTLAGYSYNNFKDFALARYGISGSPDPAFGVGGKLTTAITAGNYTDEANAVTMDAAGHVIAVGNSNNGFAIAKYSNLGVLNWSRVTQLSTAIEDARAVKVDSSGKIVVAGYAYGTQQDFAVARYGALGVLDATFNAAGALPGTVTNNIGQADEGKGMVIQSNGRIVVGGYNSTVSAGGATDQDFAAAGFCP
jgi:uncharacterized delta-60 repeat protein